MDRALWWLPLALCIACTGSDPAVGAGGGGSGGAAGTSHDGHAQGGSTARLADGGTPLDDGGEPRLDDGGAGSGAEPAPDEAGVDAASIDTGQAQNPDAGDISGAGGGIAAGGSGGEAAPACVASKPCLLASVAIPAATKVVGVKLAKVQGAYATMGSTATGEPLYLSNASSPILSAREIVFEVGANEDASEAAAYMENWDGWAGRASICISHAVIGISAPCWVVQQARIALDAGSTVVRFVAVIDPLTLEADGDSTKATVGGRWEVWGY